MMVELASFTAAFASLKAAGEIAKGLIDLRDTAVMQQKLIELQSEILAAQSNAAAAQQDQLTLLDEVGALKEKVAHLEAWDAEKERYQLTEVVAGRFAYALKEEMKGAEPEHYLCTTCFDQGQKTILQKQEHHVMRAESLYCPRCHTDIYVVGHRHPEHRASSSGQRRT